MLSRFEPTIWRNSRFFSVRDFSRGQEHFLQPLLAVSGCYGGPIGGHRLMMEGPNTLYGLLLSDPFCSNGGMVMGRHVPPPCPLSVVLVRQNRPVLSLPFLFASTAATHRLGLKESKKNSKVSKETQQEIVWSQCPLNITESMPETKPNQRLSFHRIPNQT